MIVAQVAGDVRKLERDSEIGGSSQDLLFFRIDAHDDRHHAADRSGDMVAITQQIRLVARPPACRVELEALDMIEDIAVRDRAFGQEGAESVEGQQPDRLAGEDLEGEQFHGLDISLRPIRPETQRLAVADVVAMAAPAIKEPGALAGPAVEQAARHVEGFRAVTDRLPGRGDELGPVHPRISSIISPAVALALPTTPGIPAPGWVPAPTK